MALALHIWEDIISHSSWKLIFCMFLDWCWTCTKVTTEVEGCWKGEEPITEEGWISGEGRQSQWRYSKNSWHLQGMFHHKSHI